MSDTWLIVYWMLFAGWKAVGSQEFQAVQTAQGHGSGFVYVVPKFLLTVLVIVLLAVTPPVPVWLLWGSLAALAVSWVSSAVIQIPIQLRIRATADRAAIARLVRTDWTRLTAMIVHFGFVVATVAESVS